MADDKQDDIMKPIADTTVSELARAMVARRWAKVDARSPEKRGGRPRSDALRCNCGKYTVTRAKQRCHYC